MLLRVFKPVRARQHACRLEHGKVSDGWPACGLGVQRVLFRDVGMIWGPLWKETTCKGGTHSYAKSQSFMQRNRFLGVAGVKLPILERSL